MGLERAHAQFVSQGQAERGFRFLKDLQCLAASLYRKKPERIMALMMVMTVCLFVYQPWNTVSVKLSKIMRRPFPTKRGNGFPIRRLVGCSLFCGHSLAVSGRPMAHCAQSGRGTSGFASAFGPTVHAVV